MADRAAQAYVENLGRSRERRLSNYIHFRKFYYAKGQEESGGALREPAPMLACSFFTRTAAGCAGVLVRRSIGHLDEKPGCVILCRRSGRRPREASHQTALFQTKAVA
jgi:hypothetical protein